MKRPHLIYGIYTVLLVVFLLGIIITPYIAFSNEQDSEALYSVFSLTCHQKLSRSICVFEDSSIGDCTSQEGTVVTNDQHLLKTVDQGVLGYKFPVCSRDIGLYGAMLLGAIVYPVIRKLNGKVPPAIFLILAIIPFGLDGALQLFTEIFPDIIGVYESTNTIRLITGSITGFVASIYAIPVLINLFGKTDK